jgi:hypothetical protein
MHAWLVKDRLAVAERPGGGARTHRRVRREAELDWWADAGVTAIVSGMRTRHGLLESALRGFRIHWHPLLSVDHAVREVPALVRTTLAHVDRDDGGVLVHVDLPGEWLAGVDGALRLASGLARTRNDALAQAARDGLPVGPIAEALTGAMAVRRRRAAAAGT